MKKVTLSIAIIFTFFNCFSQEKKLLENYKFRVPTYKGLSTIIGSSGAINNPYYGYGASNNFNAGGGGAYFNVKSTDKLFQIITADLNLNLGTSTNKSSIDNTTNKDFRIAPQLSINDKWFSKNNFIEFGASVNNNYAISKTNYNNSISTSLRISGNIFQTSITIGVGKGRIENITEMQTALWLIRAFESDENLTRKLTENEVIDLSKTITTSINYRVLDGRRRIKHVLTKIDNYLQTRGVVNQHDINYFTNLNDVILFANSFYRQSGTEKFIRLTPQFYSSTSNLSQTLPFNKYDYEDNQTISDLRIGFAKYKPISLTKQIDFGAAIKTTYQTSNFKNTNYNSPSLPIVFDDNFTTTKIGVDYFVKYGFFPNTRTAISISLNAEHAKYITKELARLYHNISFLLSGNYFVNYNTSLFANAQLLFYQNLYSNVYPYRYIGQNLNVGFNVGARFNL